MCIKGSLTKKSNVVGISGDTNLCLDICPTKNKIKIRHRCWNISQTQNEIKLISLLLLLAVGKYNFPEDILVYR